MELTYGKSVHLAQGLRAIMGLFTRQEETPKRFPRFDVSYTKLIEAMDVIAKAWPGVTHYFMGKSLFYADREHVLDFGRPITGATYKALVNGPLPQEAIDLAKGTGYAPPHQFEARDNRLAISRCGQTYEVRSRGLDSYEHLSVAEIEYLQSAVERVKEIGGDHLGNKAHFEAVADDTHHDIAWMKARELPGDANTMDISLWLENPDDIKAVNQMAENAHFWN